MHGETLKFVYAQQAKPYNIYKNTKLKLLKTNEAIWFNKICRDRQLGVPLSIITYFNEINILD